MSTRYVFWRMSTGKPYRGNDDKHSPIELLAEFGRISNVEPEGGVSWTGSIYNRLEIALKLALIVVYPNGDELNDSDAWGILKDAAKDVIKIVGGVRRDPLGVISTGPIHTLHYPDGKPVGDFYFYERAVSEDRELFKPNIGWEKLEEHRKWAMHRIRLLPFKKDAEDLLIRYVIALDQSDHDVAFLQMWGILEKLTNTVGGPYDETLRKAVWLFSDRSLAKGFLECARLQRNLLVHAARSTEEPDQAAYLIKTFVEPHLIHLIRNDFGVASLEEYGQHLSLPTDLDTLCRNKKWIAKTIQFLKKKAVPK